MGSALAARVLDRRQPPAAATSAASATTSHALGNQPAWLPCLAASQAVAAANLGMSGGRPSFAALLKAAEGLQQRAERKRGAQAVPLYAEAVVSWGGGACWRLRPG